MKAETPQIQSGVRRPSSFVGGGLDFSDSFSAGVSGAMLANSDTRSAVATIISTVLRSYSGAGGVPAWLMLPGALSGVSTAGRRCGTSGVAGVFLERHQNLAGRS